ncbi:glycosyltransferase family 2 protein [Beijerinckia indica]|uniref:Glycosyl transferase family 2 n=1 Tax=Beijerinckia indica subsp. indica (strain ATCC 9039 / DSM 1715 / NCIMB 8712) TaxID=395963 RepID=B2IHH3_BEII9|nr:glycosyltransferase [Beijerinckia indica]ACB94494.1 glycosyl transferase family 2 [Beijerinckia indica subsp. indica ATCC 9039]
MDVSLCITTRNRPEDLAECLRVAGGSSIPLKQIVVSDDSTDHRSRDLVREQFPKVDYVEGPRKGLGPNRNSAIAAAHGDWILFLDDDARLGVDFLKTLEPLIAAHAGEKIIYSGIEEQIRGKIFPRDQNFLGFQSRPYQADEPLNTLVINAALFPAEVCKTLLFDPRLIYGYDEVDIASRARAAGWRILLCPEAINFHYPSETNRDYYKPHTESARIYVTFKKYYGAQRKPLKALAFLGISLLHSCAHHLKTEGFRGLLSALALHRSAWKQISAWQDEVRQ